MNIYLKEVKSLVKKTEKKVLIVMGNESVDLDSAVSSISLASHLNKVKCKSHVIPSTQQLTDFLVAPVINSTREELFLKTEVTYWLLKHQIELENLLCKDEINLNEDVDSLVLVDHHVSEFRGKVISVLDHRPFDPISNLSKDCFKDIQEVGSCATLVCNAIRKDVVQDNLREDFVEELTLCYGAIVLDSINFSKDADKVRPLDINVAEEIERTLNIENVFVHRKNLYNELVTARADVSALDSLQLLSKDLKIISNETESVRLAIPGVNVFKYIEMENAAANVRIFAERNNVDVVVLMGMHPKGDSVERFIGVINIKNEALFNGVSCREKDIFFKSFKNIFHQVIKAMLSMRNPNLQLECKPADFMSGTFYQQMNVKASRKQILPVIKQILNNF